MIVDLKQFLDEKDRDKEIYDAREMILNICSERSGIKSGLEHSRKIERVRGKFGDAIRRTDRILESLYQKKAVTTQEYELINSQKTGFAVTNQLLDVISVKPVGAYQCLLEALDATHQGHLHQLIEDNGG